MKKHFYTIGSIVILLFAAFIFILLPAMVGSRSQQKLPPFGSYDGKEIKYEQGTAFSNAVSNYAEMLKMQGQEVTENSYFYIFNYAFNSTVTKMAYDNAVAKSGWQVSKAAIDRQMLPYFYDETGKYSARLFKQTPESQKQELHAQLKDSLTSQRYYEDVFGSSATIGKNTTFGMKSSSKEIPFIRTMGEDTRSFDAAVFAMNNYPESEVASFGKAHADLFASYDFSVITVSDESTAKTVQGRLNKNEIVFADAVTEYSTKNYSDDQGKLNNKFNYQVKNIIADEKDFAAVCALKNGEISGIVKTSNGYSIFKADADAVQPDFANADMIKSVSSYMNTYEKGIIEDYFTNIAKNFASSAVKDGFDAACKEYKTEKKSVPAFALNYGNLPILGTMPIDSTSEFSAVANDENFLKAAFALKQSEISEPLVLGQNIIVLQMKEKVSGGTDQATSEQTFPAEIQGFDQESGQNALMSSPKIVNNVMSVFFTHFMNNNK